MPIVIGISVNIVPISRSREESHRHSVFDSPWVDNYRSFIFCLVLFSFFLFPGIYGSMSWMTVNPKIMSQYDGSKSQIYEKSQNP